MTLALANEIENARIEGYLNSAYHSLRGNSLNNSIIGNIGQDSLFGGSGNDTLNGSDGVDLIDYSQVLTASGMTDVAGNLTVNLTTGLTQDSSGLLGSDTLVNIENIQTGKGNDSVTGSTAANVITTDITGDTVGSSDTLVGGAGRLELLE